MDKGDVEVIMVKIDIISGFLGAGKTTLIKKLLQDAFKGQQVVLIENEFGEIGIDGGFLKDAGIEIKEMNSGCICCSLVGDFGTALKEVVEKYHPDRIVIEPSGVGKLSDVIHAVENLHLEADGEVKLNSAVTVVDVLKCKMYLKNFGEFFKNQVEAAGTIILSRTDTKKATPEKIEAAIELIRELNPDATIITTPVEDLGGQKILDTIEGMKIDLSHVEEEHDHCCAHEHHHDHDHDHGHTHHHTAPADIAALLDALDAPAEVKDAAKSIYARIADAEAKAHGMPVEKIHFHEVGALDAVADVTGACLAVHMLRPDHITASPVHLGSGQVRCAHGIVPVPAPATAHLLEGVLCYTGDIRGELCTPTGAALLTHFAESFGPMPVMSLEKTGYGVGKKEFPAANCVRAFWGESGAPQQAEIVELCCHIDDMTAEALAFAGEQLLAQGALDISCAPLTMKKGRAGVSFTVLCKPRDEGRIAHAILRETTTNGVRTRRCGKYILTPSVKTVETAYGPIRVKCADGEGIHRKKPEYEDVASAARTAGLPFQKVWEDVLSAIRGEVSQNG